MTQERNPIEDQDPELQLNPIYKHKMELQRAREAERKKAKGLGVEGKSGGLKRLGLGMGPVNEPTGGAKAKPTDQLNHFLASQGVQVGGGNLAGRCKASDVSPESSGKYPGVSPSSPLGLPPSPKSEKHTMAL